MLATPCAVVDRARLDANIERMADAVRHAGVAMRPHAKTHKTIEIARRQLAAGAAGLTVATLHEAGVFARAGVDDVFIAYPVWAAGRTAALVRELHETISLRVGTDSVDGAEMLGAAVSGSTRRLEALVEIDCGLRRSGVAPDEASKVAAAARAAGLDVVGVFTHAGHAYAGANAVAAAATAERQALADAADALRADGHDVRVVSAGSTPTATQSARPPVTEERPGTYVFGDAAQIELGACTVEDVALHVISTVVSTSVPGQAVIDAGSKSLSSDRRAWQRGHGLLADHPGCIVERLSEEHGVVTAPDGHPLPGLGELVRVIPNHVCAVVNLSPAVVVVEKGQIVDEWSVIARR